MKSLYRGVGKLWRGGGDKRRGAARQTRKMDPTTRRALQSSVQEETTAVEQDFDEIQAQLEQAIQQWEIASEKERFVGVRYRKYRQVLDAQARELHEERERIIQTQQEQQPEEDPDAAQQPEPADAEEGNVEDLAAAQKNLDRRMEKWEEDEDALQKIAATHKQILVTCEEMRRNIDRLEKKKKEMISLKEECDHFLTVAGEAQERENSGQSESSDRAEGLQQSQDDVDVETTESLQESTTGEGELLRIGNEEQLNEDVKDDGDGDDETKDEETGERPGSDASENIEAGES